MSKEKLEDTVCVLAEEDSALLQPHVWIGVLVTVLWLSRPEKRCWRGVSMGTDRQTEWTDKRTDMAFPRLHPTFPD